MRNCILKFCAMLLAISTSAIHLQAMDEYDGATAKGFYSGTGTKTDPYRIFTASQFLYFLQQTKDGNTFSGQYIELCNDIAFSYEAVEGGDFYGDFDGNDHTIQVDSYWSETGWTLFNLYGSMHDVQFVRANEVMSIYTGGILYNCRFEYPNGSYHGWWTVYLCGGTIANCISNSAYYKNSSKYGGSCGLVYGNQSSSYCSNCYFPITSYSYGNTLASNYYGVKESCGEEAGNDWVQSHTEYAYKSWPLTFSPTYPEYQIKEQPQPYNPSVVCPNSDEALFQWYYQERKPITIAEDITNSSSIQTRNIEVLDDDVVLSFDFATHGWVSSGRYSDSYNYAQISVNGEEIVSVYDERSGTYSCQAPAGTYEISCKYSDISNIRITYPTETLVNETSSILSKQTIMEKSGAYFCQVSYGKDCDVMYSDYIDYEKLLTIDNVTYVVNEDSTATVLWVADKAVDITILETVNYDDANYPVTTISSKAFVDCTSLASIKCKTLDVPILLGGTTFLGLIPSNIILYVPIGRKSAYSTANGWKEFSNIVTSASQSYSAVVNCGTGGEALLSASSVNIGDPLKLFIVPNDGYKVSSLLLNGSKVNVKNNIYNIASVTENVVFDVEFTQAKLDTVEIIVTDTIEIEKIVTDTIKVVVTDTIEIETIETNTIYLAEINEIPVPEITFVDGMLNISCALQGVKIFYCIDGTFPDKEYIAPVAIDKDCVVTAIAAFVSDANTKEIIGTGIGGVTDEIVSCRYFTETGVEIDEPREGVNIMIIKYASGKTETKKVVVRKK